MKLNSTRLPAASRVTESDFELGRFSLEISPSSAEILHRPFLFPAAGPLRLVVAYLGQTSGAAETQVRQSLREQKKKQEEKLLRSFWTGS